MLTFELRQALELGQQIRLERMGMDTRYIRAFPLAASDSLLLLHEVVDFRLDGWSIVRLADVTGVRSGPDERFTERVLGDEGRLDEALAGPQIPLDSWAAALTALYLTRRLLFIETKPDGADESVYVGRVHDVGTEQVLVREFDTVARWDEDLSEIPFNDIRRIRFGERYLEVFERYVDRGR